MGIAALLCISSAIPCKFGQQGLRDPAHGTVMSVPHLHVVKHNMQHILACCAGSVVMGLHRRHMGKQVTHGSTWLIKLMHNEGDRRHAVVGRF